jgi:hypothetical protein
VPLDLPANGRPRTRLCRLKAIRRIESGSVQVVKRDRRLRLAGCRDHDRSQSPDSGLTLRGLRRPEWIDMGPVNEVVNDPLQKRKR